MGAGRYVAGGLVLAILFIGMLFVGAQAVPSVSPEAMSGRKKEMPFIDPDLVTVRHEVLADAHARSRFADGILFASVVTTIARLKGKHGMNKLGWIGGSGGDTGEHRDTLHGVAVLDLSAGDAYLDLPVLPGTFACAAVYDLYHHVHYLDGGTTHRLHASDFDTSLVVLIIRIGVRPGTDLSRARAATRLKAPSSSASIPSFGMRLKDSKKLREAGEFVEKWTGRTTPENVQRLANAKSVQSTTGENAKFLSAYNAHFTDSRPRVLDNTPGFTSPSNETKLGISLYWMFVLDKTKATYFSGKITRGRRFAFRNLPDDISSGFWSLTLFSEDNLAVPQEHYSSMLGNVARRSIEVGPFNQSMVYGIRVYRPGWSATSYSRPRVVAI